MRGKDSRTGELFSYVDLEARVRRDHPLCAIREIVNEVIFGLAGEFADPGGLGEFLPERALSDEVRTFDSEVDQLVKKRADLGKSFTGRRSVNA